MTYAKYLRRKYVEIKIALPKWWTGGDPDKVFFSWLSKTPAKVISYLESHFETRAM